MKLSEQELRKITLAAIEELGESATPAGVKSIVNKSAEIIDSGDKLFSAEEISSGRIILTSFGPNHPGVIAAITKAFSDNECDIHDLSQKIMGDFYTLIMIVDITNSPKDLREIQEDIDEIGDKMKIKVYLQHEDVFRYMHRI